jgi:hypothetical protein
VFLQPQAKLVLGLRREHCRLLVDHRIAKPLAIGALDVAARCKLDENERERTIRQRRR